ncbi:MAG: diaminopimelate epimerase [Fimbriimonadales bacterium]
MTTDQRQTTIGDPSRTQEQPALGKLPFWKVESIGNDFVLVHLDDIERLGGATNVDNFLERLAIEVSPRKFGIGSDGLLALALLDDGSLLLRMFNPDGTEDFCGNGIRCGFDHGLRQGWVQASGMRMVHGGRQISGTADDLRETAREKGPEALAAINDVLPRTRYVIEFELPAASYLPQDIPIIREDEAFNTGLFRIDGEVYSGSVLSTGTAHTILPVRKLPGDEEFFRVSPQIESHSMFPERTSVMWVRERQAFQIELRIWERGAGETKGCGTGSTAAAIDYLRRKGLAGTVQVLNPGGIVWITAESWDSPPRVAGMAAERFRGEVSL